MSGDVVRTNALTADVNRRRCRQRRDNMIADVVGERRRDNSTAAIEPLLL